MENFTFESVSNHYSEMNESIYLFKKDLEEYLKNVIKEKGSELEDAYVIEFEDSVMVSALSDDSIGERRDLVDINKVIMYVSDDWIAFQDVDGIDYSINEIDVDGLYDIAKEVKNF